jgi:hypothetical protein
MAGLVLAAVLVVGGGLMDSGVTLTTSFRLVEKWACAIHIARMGLADPPSQMTFG